MVIDLVSSTYDSICRPPRTVSTMLRGCDYSLHAPNNLFCMKSHLCDLVLAVRRAGTKQQRIIATQNTANFASPAIVQTGKNPALSCDSVQMAIEVNMHGGGSTRVGS